VLDRLLDGAGGLFRPLLLPGFILRDLGIVVEAAAALDANEAGADAAAATAIAAGILKQVAHRNKPFLFGLHMAQPVMVAILVVETAQPTPGAGIGKASVNRTPCGPFLRF